MKLDINLLKNLCLSGGISGNEDSVREIIIKEISSYGTEHYTDPMGNLMVFKKGRKRPLTRLMVAAHMDEVGLIITNITENGFLGFDIVGGITNRILPGTNVLVGENKIHGVIGLKPIHLTSKAELTHEVKLDDLFIDIGAQNKSDAQNHVNIGDYVIFESVFDIDQDRIISKAIDDRAGCFILINMIKSDLEYDTCFVFTVQEEIGLHGAFTAAYTVNPQAALIVESTTANDIPNVDESSTICKLNEGPAISFMDKRTLYDKEYYKLAMSLADENNIKVQPKSGVTGGNDAGAINISRGGIRTIAISVPCRYLHTPGSILSINDLNGTYMLSSLLAQEISSIEF